MATALLEVMLSWLLAKSKGHDAKSFYARSAFAGHAEQTVAVASPECGPSGAALRPEEHTHDRAAGSRRCSGRRPRRSPTANYSGIPALKTRVEAADFVIDDADQALLKGGFHYGKTRTGAAYIPPRPLLNHGPHRYFFMVMALGEPLDPRLLRSTPTRNQIANAIVGKVLGWGVSLALSRCCEGVSVSHAPVSAGY
ncbi:hypothetical protein DL764_002603 [Monosporascus ibericus]|uniref:Phosphatidylethanolamine-binding protein n=1 Tax=Monosporascus ibericus TaxID=155417 RepID=A0A4Q4TKZ0_9PEZI|nr:hypothetical protein DL764_002603 [Monosporascus ibericus]